MPPPPDNHMDDRLQAYAKKRREDLGAPLEPHPATLQLLQAEVARVFPRKSSERESWFQAVKMFWPRMAFAVSILLVLGFGSWSLLKSNRAAVEMKMSKLEQMEESKSRTPPTVPAMNEPAPSNAEKTSELGLNQSTREFKAVHDESRPLAPPGNRPALDTLADKDIASRSKGAEAAVKESNESEVLSRRRDGLDKNGPVIAGETLAAGQSIIVTAQKPQATTRPNPTPAIDLSEKSKSKDPIRLAFQDATKRELDPIGVVQPATAAASAAMPLEAGKKAALADNLNLRSPGGGGFGGGGQGAPAGVGGAIDVKFENYFDAASRASGGSYYFEALNSRFDTQSFSRNNLFGPWYFGGRVGLSDLALTGYVNTNPLAMNWRFANEGLDLFAGNRADWMRQEANQDASFLYSASRSGGAASPSGPGEISVRFQMSNQITRANVPSSDVAKLTSLENRKGTITADKLPATATANAVPASSRSRDAASLNSERVASILRSFDVEQTGDRIRITDADGSVYEGRLLPAAADREAASKIALPNVKPAQLRQTVDRYSLGESSLTTAGVSFQASGTNRGLNQVVVINGSWSGAILPAGRVAASWALMTGKARVGATNEILINAVQVKP